MSWSKRQLVSEAYSELALADYDFDLQPEEMQTALRRLDTLMATWQARGVDVGYVFSASPDASDLDQDSGLPLVAVEAVYLNLAVALGAAMGKALPASTLRNAKQAYDGLLSYVARIDLLALTPQPVRTWRGYQPTALPSWAQLQSAPAPAPAPPAGQIYLDASAIYLDASPLYLA